MGSTVRILVIDDHVGTVKAVKRVLQQAGYEVLTAFDGMTGLRMAREDKPALIILDIMMPGMDGYEVCSRLQSDPETAHITVLMLTGMGRLGSSDMVSLNGVREQIAGYNVGAVEFLTKPVGAKELVQRVKVLLWVSGIQSGI